MVPNPSSSRILLGRTRRPVLPGTFAAAFRTLTYYAKRSIATDFERGVDFVKHLDDLIAEHPVATIQRLGMPDGLDYISEFLRIRQHPGEDSVVNEVYIPFLKTITNITARYSVSIKEPLHSIVQELFDLSQFFSQTITVLCEKKLRDIDSLVIFVYICMVSDRTIISFRTFVNLIHEILNYLNDHAHPSARLIEHLLGGGIAKQPFFPEGIHDNDKVDFRQISIVPTIDEVLSGKISDVYLPLSDGSDGFLAEHPVGRLVDSSFRLLRHDMLTHIRDNLFNTVGGFAYFNAKLTKRDDDYDNATLDVDFPVPEGTGRWFGLYDDEGDESSVECNSKWFPKGALVCLCKQERRPTFFGEITYNSAYDSRRQGRKGGAPGSSGNRFTCTITIAIANWINEDEIKDNIRFSVPFTLVQVCHGYFSYKPVLESLQNSTYCPAFKFLVQPETSQPSTDIPRVLASLLDDDPDFAARFSQLDSVQRMACSLPFRDDLAVSLIQGPPGTGKTFIGTIVATGLIKFPSNKILCICFSNHQLDQFLESIVDIGVTQVVRLGGRSHSEKLAMYNLNMKVDLARSKITEARRKTESFSETRRKIIEEARIIGCTATGAAIFRNILAKANCNILLIEEAGELLEANLLTSINQHTQKIIMIGDHMQLRPKVHNHDLSVESGKGYDLNRSTFERLVYAGHPLVTLQCQHRMRPEISRIVRGLCYEDLTDAEKVKQYLNINGLKHNVIFVDHQFPETRDRTGGIRENADSSTTRVNKEEALITVKIALHMLKQGYSYDDIVILTPYLGQLNEIRIILEKQFKIKSKLGDRDENEYDNALCSGLFSGEAGDSLSEQTTFAIRVATVDNFQGEEALIIIASLVRSNPELNIGFLKQVQRVNVLISRAKAGLILVGNSSCLKKASPLWGQVLSCVNITFGLPTICQRHNVNVFLKNSEDFDELSPFGGCTAVCNLALPCGHRCKKTCHDPGQIEHETCAMKHPALCAAGHRIRTSSVDKRKCQVDVYANCPNCSNIIQRKCSDVARESNCLYCRYKRLMQSVTDRLTTQYKSRIRVFSEINDEVIVECDSIAYEEAQNFGKRLVDICKVVGPQFQRLLEGYRMQQEVSNPRSLVPKKCDYCQNAIFRAEAFICQAQKTAICLGCVRSRIAGQLSEMPDRLFCPCPSQGCKEKFFDDAQLLPCLDEAALEKYFEFRELRFYNNLIVVAQIHFRR